MHNNTPHGSKAEKQLGSKLSMLICMKGHPGCGKSSLARGLAQHISACLIDKDDVRDCFQPQVSAGTGKDVNWNQLSYDVMFNLARTQLDLGLNVVVDCPLARVQLYDSAQAIATQCSAQLVVVEVVCSNESQWRSRLEARAASTEGTNQDHKPAKWEQLQALLTSYNGCWTWNTNGSRQLEHCITVDTAGINEASVLAVALQKLASAGIL